MALKVLGGVGPLRGSLLGSNELPRREHCPLDDAPPFSSRDGVGWRSSARSFQRLFKDSPDFSLSLPMQSPSSEDWRKKASQLQAVNEAGDAADLKAFCRPLNMESSFRSHSSCDQKKTSFHSPNEHVYPLHASSSGIGTSGGVPVYVMLPLDSVNPNNTLNRRRALYASLLALKSAGAEGIMVDVWWGLVERDTPGQYNWAGYRELMEMVKLHGLKAQAVMSFHQCGGNVGDSCHIPLPQWVLQEMKANPDIVYTDKSERRNQEYLSLGCDTFPVLKGRTPVQAYADFMRSFRDAFHDLLGETIVEIQVGMGPAGELRYPAYPESNGTWRFPGIGEFQCYDKYMIASLKACADRLGKREWGLGGPHNAGHYTQWPDETGFFHRDGSWNSPYGNFFLEWYSEMLLAHGHRILSSAASIFRGTGVKLSGKVAGIHWHYGSRSHAAELTAGYYNTRNRDGYLPVAQMFGRHGVTLNFTCFEMRDTEQPSHAQSCPEGLLNQVTLVSRKARVHLAGENALPRYDEAAHHQVIRNSRLQLHHAEKGYEPLCSFTFLRMNERLFHSENWSRFVWFVRQMAEGRTIEHWEEEHRHTEIHVNAIKPLRMEAAAALMHS